MHAFLAFFLGSSLASIVFRVFSLLGLGVITYTGVNILMGEVVDLFLTYTNKVPGEWLQLLGYIQFDRACSLVISAYQIKLTVITSKKFIGLRQ